jgi:hypothetical protein
MCSELSSGVMNHHLDSYLQKKIIHYTNDDLSCPIFTYDLSISYNERKGGVFGGSRRTRE